MVAVAPQYDAVARAYERLIAPRYARVAEAMVARLDIQPDDAVLDIGAGTGGVARRVLPLLGAGGRIALLDLSPGMLEVARDVLAAANPGGASVELVVGDLTALPFETGSFDGVVAQFTPLQDSETGLGEAARVLATDGRLTIAWWGPAYRELDLLNVVRARVGIDPAVPPDPAATFARIAAAGFVDVEHEELRFPASYPDAAAYLAYRAAFGRAIVLDDDTWARYWAELSAEVERIAAAEGSVELDWSVILVRARRG